MGALAGPQAMLYENSTRRPRGHRLEGRWLCRFKDRRLRGRYRLRRLFAPRGSWPRSATGAASRQPTRHSVNALACKAPEIGVDCEWQSAHRDALLMPFNFPTVASSEAARGVDRGKCGLRSLPGFWARSGRMQQRTPCLAGRALDRPLSDETVVRHAGLPAGLRRRARSRL